MSIFDDIRRDREAGTPGTWGIADGGVNPTVRGGDGFDSEHICEINHYRQERLAEQTPNAHRIARVPELERIALVAEDAIAAMELAEAQLIAHGFDGHGSGLTAALAKLREATA